MDALDQLENVVRNVVIGLAHEMAAAGTADELLPVDEMTVEKTPAGVIVKFIGRPVKRPKPRPKALDES